jgi:cellulase/cellobiase CelA1
MPAVDYMMKTGVHHQVEGSTAAAEGYSRSIGFLDDPDEKGWGGEHAIRIGNGVRVVDVALSLPE